MFLNTVHWLAWLRASLCAASVALDRAGTRMRYSQSRATVPIQHDACTGPRRVCAGSDMAAAAERWTAVRGPDAQALADIEAAFYKLVGGRKLGFLDPGFLRLIAHIALGAPACSHKTPHGHWVCGRAEGLRATVQIFRLRAVQVNLEGRLLDRCFGFCEVDCQRHGACKSPGRMSSFAAEEVHSVAVAGHWGGHSKH